MENQESPEKSSAKTMLELDLKIHQEPFGRMRYRSCRKNKNPTPRMKILLPLADLKMTMQEKSFL